MRRTCIQDLIAHVEELLDAMDGMDCADYPMVPIVLELIQQDLAAAKEVRDE